MTILSPSEDLRDWVVDNWFTVEFISERVKEGILNVIDTYEVENGI